MSTRLIEASIDRIANLRRRQKLLYYTRFEKFVFIHINKTGGSNIENALGIPFLHRTARRFRKDMGEKRWQRIFSFAIVRNPWDKVVSQYHHRRTTNQTNLGTSPVTFNEWVALAYGNKDPLYYDKPRMFMPQASYITDSSGKVIVDFIGKFENLQNDFDEICTRIGRPQAVLPHLKKSDRENYRAYYSTENQKIVGNWFANDIELFGYDF